MPRARALFVASLLVFAAVRVLQGVGALEGLELAAYDRMLIAAVGAGRLPPPPILLVQITEADIREQGHWPISDRILARALAILADSGARVIGLDIYRDLPVAPGIDVLAGLLREEPRIVAVSKFGTDEEDGVPGPPALAGSGRIGFNDLLVDDDDTVRRALLFQDDGEGDVEYAFALRLALAALAAEGIAARPDPLEPTWLRLGPETLRPFQGEDGGYVAADDAGYQFLLDFRHDVGAFDTVPFGDVLRGEVAAERVRDGIVIVGARAKSLPDLFPVPLAERIPGMEVHAHAVAQLVRTGHGEAPPLRVLSEGQEAALLLVVSALGCLLGFGLPGRPLLGVAGLVLLAIGGAIGIGLLASLLFRAGWWLPPVAPAAAWIGAAGLVTAWVSGRERGQRSQLMRIFARHVSTDVADEVWRRRDDFFRDGRPRPQRLPATVLFVDIRGYTAQAARLDPAALMDWVNAFMGRMAALVERHGGVVDDYFGDGLKANFGVPIERTELSEIDRDARHAVACAQAMRDALASLNEEFASRGLPACQAKIGIDSGPVVAGSIGSADRLKYTVVGEIVVTAERLEGTDAVPHDYEAEPCRILVSERTSERLGGTVALEPVGELSLKGMEAPVRAFRVALRAGSDPSPGRAP